MSKIGLDLDGVVYSYDSAARYMLREYRGCTGLDDPSTSWDSIQQTVNQFDWAWLQDMAPSLGLFRYGHIIKGAIIGVRQLVLSGHSISIVTHRPRSAVRDTIAFLDYAHLPISEVHILSDGQAKSSIDADILIDDRIENVQEWADAGRRSILFTQPWNRDMRDSRIRRAKDWRGVCDVVRSGEGARGDRAGVSEDAQASYQRWRKEAGSRGKGVLES